MSESPLAPLRRRYESPRWRAGFVEVSVLHVLLGVPFSMDAVVGIIILRFDVGHRSYLAGPCPGRISGVSLVGNRIRSSTCTFLSCTCASVARFLAFPVRGSARLVAATPKIGSRLAEELDHVLPERDHLKRFGT